MRATNFATRLASLLVFCLAAWAPPAMAARQAAMVIDANTGRTLHADRPDAPRYPASLTKMMTIYMVFDEIRAGRASFDSLITFSARAANAQPSKLGLKEGDSIKLLDALKALITKSANDVAYAVAEHIGGSRDAFAQRMTRRARELGMTNTRFANASGLTNRNQLTTARDMLTLALHLIDDYPQHYHLFSLRSFTYRGRTYRSHNGLLGKYPGTDGFKTGYTRASGFNLVASARRGGAHVIGVVFGAKSAGARNRKMRALLDAAFIEASAVKTRRPPPGAQTAPPIASRRAPRPANPPIEIARVRAVTLAGRGRSAAAPRQPARPPAKAGSSAITAPPIGSETPAAFGFGRGPLATTYAPPTQRLPDTPAQTALAGFIRQPSTLDAQAESLDGGANIYAAPAQAAAGFAVAAQGASVTAARALPPAYGLRGPLPAQGGYQVQVGAYGSIIEAQQQIENVRLRASALLSGYATVTMPFDKSGKRYYRARFAGFDSRNATATCLELRRLQVDCFVARAN